MKETDELLGHGQEVDWVGIRFRVVGVVVAILAIFLVTGFLWVGLGLNQIQPHITS